MNNLDREILVLELRAKELAKDHPEDEAILEIVSKVNECRDKMKEAFTTEVDSTLEIIHHLLAAITNKYKKTI